VPDSVVVIDETIVAFKGRWKARQHVRGKPHATGLKLFSNADSTGYLYDLWLYYGKSSEKNKSSNTVDYVFDLTSNMPFKDK
jgi:hypothetical protein